MKRRKPASHPAVYTARALVMPHWSAGSHYKSLPSTPAGDLPPAHQGCALPLAAWCGVCDSPFSYYIFDIFEGAGSAADAEW